MSPYVPVAALIAVLAVGGIAYSRVGASKKATVAICTLLAAFATPLALIGLAALGVDLGDPATGGDGAATEPGSWGMYTD